MQKWVGFGWRLRPDSARHWHRISASTKKGTDVKGDNVCAVTRWFSSCSWGCHSLIPTAWASCFLAAKNHLRACAAEDRDEQQHHSVGPGLSALSQSQRQSRARCLLPHTQLLSAGRVLLGHSPSHPLTQGTTGWEHPRYRTACKPKHRADLWK